MGRAILLTRKSSKSIMVEPSPKGCMPDKRLKPRAQGRESSIIKNILTKDAFFLLQPVKSIQHEMIFSKTAITVENAANAIKIKNRLPQSLPPAI